MTYLDGTDDDDYISATSNNEYIRTFKGNDTIDGDAGADTMVGGEGNDIYYVDDINDTVIEEESEGIDEVITSVSYVLDDNIENLTLDGSDNIYGNGNELDNIIMGNSGNNVLDGKTGADTMLGGKGNDTYYVDDINDTVIEEDNEGIDKILASIAYILDNNVENLTLVGSDNINGSGNNLDNIIMGNSGNNVLNGDSGADTMLGGGGDDTYYVDDISDTIVEKYNEGIDNVISSISYVLDDNIENLTLAESANIDGSGNDFDNIITGNSGNNVLIGGFGDDTLTGGAGNDTLDGGQDNDTFIFSSNWGQDIIKASSGYDVIKFDADANVNLDNLAIIKSGNNLELINIDTNDKITVENHFASTNNYIQEIILSDNVTYLSRDQIKQIAEHTIIGDNNNNTLTGDDSDNFIWGMDGNDDISGGTGNDYMNGGSGNDTYRINNNGGKDTIIDSSGIDKLVFGDSLVKTDYTLIKDGNNLIIKSLKGTSQTTIDNWFLNDSYKIESFEFSDGTIITSDQIKDLFTTSGQFKGWGDPHFIFNNARAFDFQGASGGSSGIYKLLENKDISLVAELASSIAGDYATTIRSFTLTAETEAGTAEVIYKNSKNYSFKLDGVKVNDLSNLGITLSNESTSSGIVTVVTFNDRQFTFSSGSVITNIIKVDDKGILAQVPIASAQTGYEDIDQVLVNSPGIIMAAPFAFLQSSDPQKLAEAFIKMLNLNSSYSASVKSTMTGASFNFNDRTGINYNYNPDNDSVRTVYEKAELCVRIAYAVLNDKNCSDDMKINAFANWIKTSQEAMKIDIESNSGSLASRYQAGHGYSASQWNEYLGTLIFAESADINKNGTKDNIIDVNNDGLTDGFDLNADGILQDNEKVSIDLTKVPDTFVEGNSDNTVYNVTESFSKLIIRDDGGNDTVKFDESISKEKISVFMNNNDLVISYDNGDNNQVVIQNQQSSQRAVERFELADGSYLTDTDIDEIIQKFALYQEEKGIQITSIDDIRNNSDLIDIVENFWHSTNNSDTSANENAFVDTNEARSDKSFELSNDGTVNLYLTGSADINGTGDNYNNYIVGNSGNNILDGGFGTDTLKGGSGADTYIINDTDTITENANEGIDTVISSITYSLGSNLENLILAGTDNINATGNSLNNTITGNSGNNIIDGKSGADTMIGGDGNDTYYVNSSKDVITESSNQGLDTVISSISYTLGSDLENLTLLGSSNINATGNSLNNVITGNSGNNILKGSSGNDTYAFGTNSGLDTINDTSGTLDKVYFNSDIARTNIAMFMDSSNNLIIDYGSQTGTDKVTIQNQSKYTIERIKLDNGQFLTNSDINKLIQSMTAFANNHDIQMTNVSDVRNNQDLMNLVAASWHS